MGFHPAKRILMYSKYPLFHAMNATTDFELCSVPHSSLCVEVHGVCSTHGRMDWISISAVCSFLGAYRKASGFAPACRSCSRTRSLFVSFHVKVAAPANTATPSLYCRNPWLYPLGKHNSHRYCTQEQGPVPFAHEDELIPANTESSQA